MSPKNSPFVFICAGMSLDGKISNFKRQQAPISSDNDKEMLLDARAEADAILIGGNTLRQDDPSLTLKTQKRKNDRIRAGRAPEPIKITVVSNAGSLDLDGKFFTEGEGEKMIFTTAKTTDRRIEEIRKKAKVYVLGEKVVDLEKMMFFLFEEGIKSVLVEGGGELNAALLEKDLVDEIRLKIGDLIIGGRDAATLVDGEGFDLLGAKKVKFQSVVQGKNHIIVKAKIVK